MKFLTLPAIFFMYLDNSLWVNLKSFPCKKGEMKNYESKLSVSIRQVNNTGVFNNSLIIQ